MAEALDNDGRIRRTAISCFGFASFRSGLFLHLVKVNDKVNQASDQSQASIP